MSEHLSACKHFAMDTERTCSCGNEINKITAYLTQITIIIKKTSLPIKVVRFKTFRRPHPCPVGTECCPQTRRNEEQKISRRLTSQKTPLPYASDPTPLWAGLDAEWGQRDGPGAACYRELTAGLVGRGRAGPGRLPCFMPHENKHTSDDPTWECV